MAFADWKKKSKVYLMFRSRAENYGIGLTECCQAAYKAGERQGRKDAEEDCKARDCSAGTVPGAGRLERSGY